MAHELGGYDDERFETIVNRNLHCLICFNVLKDPVMCRRNQHYFCRGCITQQLRTNSRTCPTCADELSVETLSDAPRIVKDILDELSIRCDYYDRGCRELVQLQNLRRHVAECVFEPVVCGNEGCGETVSKRDRTYHECEQCEFRKLKCHNCGEMSTMMADLRTKNENMNTNMEAKLEAVHNEVRGIKRRLEIESEERKRVERERDVGGTASGEREKQHIIFVAGGVVRQRNSVEILNYDQKLWSLSKPMPAARCGASSFIYNNHVTVAGGLTDDGIVDDMISMNIHPNPDLLMNWSDLDTKMPAKMFLHSSVVYKDSLFVTGGVDADRHTNSDCIYEVQLKPPYTVKLVYKMPVHIECHSTVLCDNIIVIVGESTADNKIGIVLSYDIEKKECRQLPPPLPYPVAEIATVKWAENVVIIGGVDMKDSNTLNTVVIYNVKTGKSHMLPPMLHKRTGCMAVVIENTIVVLGGRDERRNVLKSVECFSFDRYTWEYLPDMKEARYLGTAVVI